LETIFHELNQTIEEFDGRTNKEWEERLKVHFFELIIALRPRIRLNGTCL
uniref:Sucrose synthase n=1 Tax=Rodentolepis nana TaxID=102285 RepID=A0A0R3TRH8_RODNA